MLLALFLLSASAVLPQEPPQAPTLDASNFQEWRDYLLPDAQEAAFDEVPWIPSFAEGMREADRRGRPLLLWAMNGHPLGCT